MKLVIAEKPSVAQDLVKVLDDEFKQREGFWEGRKYLVSWAVGHMLELAEPEDYDPELKRWSLEKLPILPERFQRKVRSGQSKQLKVLKRLAKRADVEELVNACDAAREGELIFREIQEYVGVDKPVRRLWLQSMTPESIRQAFTEMKDAHAYDGLGAAALCRSEADWLIGMNATRALTRRLKGRKERGVWSAGRVQTPTLALLVHREMKVLAHVPKPFWRLRGRFRVGDHEYEGLWRRRRGARDGEKIWELDEADAIRAACLGGPDEEAGRVPPPARAREEVSESRRPAPPLHSLSTLQREANARFGMSASRTLNAAQRLYEQFKLITYPRTDANALPADYRGHVAKVVGVLAGQDVRGCFHEAERGEAIQEAARVIRDGGRRNERRNFDDSKVSDHFAIVPTGTLPNSPLGGDDARIYELILRRFLAAFMEPSTWQKVVRETEVLVPAGPQSFFTESNRLIRPGWQLVDRRPPAAELLPDLGVPPGETAAVTVLEVLREEDATRPPRRYTEAGLLQAMEKASDLDLDQHSEIEDAEVLETLRQKGLGTPATRADIIEGLIARGYVLRSGKSLRPTAKGIMLIDVLQRVQADHLAKAELTAEMEFHLYQVEQGQRRREDYMAEVADSVRDLVERMRGFDYEDLYRDEPPVGHCPVDGAPMVETLRSYRCSNPEHGWTLWKEHRGRFINRPVAEKILADGDSGPLEGFIGFRGRPYAGRLRLKRHGEGDPVLEFEPVREFRTAEGEEAVAPEEISFPVDPEPLGPCGRCGEGVVVETPTHYVCRRDGGEEGCGARLPRSVCKREMRREEALPFFGEEGHTDWFEDFTSRKGRPFTARLVRRPDGRHAFEFKPRSGGRKKAGSKKVAGKKVTAKKTGKKTTKKKAGKKAAKKEA